MAGFELRITLDTLREEKLIWKLYSKGIHTVRYNLLPAPIRINIFHIPFTRMRFLVRASNQRGIVGVVHLFEQRTNTSDKRIKPVSKLFPGKHRPATAITTVDLQAAVLIAAAD